MDYWVQHTQMWLNNTYGNNPYWVRLSENGVTGWNTIYGLTRALQIELGLSTPNGNKYLVCLPFVLFLISLIFSIKQASLLLKKQVLHLLLQ